MKLLEALTFLPSSIYFHLSVMVTDGRLFTAVYVCGVYIWHSFACCSAEEAMVVWWWVSIQWCILGRAFQVWRDDEHGAVNGEEKMVSFEELTLELISELMIYHGNCFKSSLCVCWHFILSSSLLPPADEKHIDSFTSVAKEIET